MDPERILSLTDNHGLTSQGLAHMILDCAALLSRADLTSAERLKLDVVKGTLQTVSGHLLTILEPLADEINAAKQYALVENTVLEE